MHSTSMQEKKILKQNAMPTRLTSEGQGQGSHSGRGPSPTLKRMWAKTMMIKRLKYLSI